MSDLDIQKVAKEAEQFHGCAVMQALGGLSLTELIPTVAQMRNIMAEDRKQNRNIPDLSLFVGTHSPTLLDNLPPYLSETLYANGTKLFSTEVVIDADKKGAGKNTVETSCLPNGGAAYKETKSETPRFDVKHN
jgi:hypothetical protein